MKNPLVVLIIPLLLILAACGEPKIDAKNEEAFKTSIQKVKDSLPLEEQDKFQRALTVITFDGVNPLQLAASGPEGAEAIVHNGMKKLAGKTGQEVIILGDQLAAQRKEKERAQALIEIGELEAKKQQSIEAQSKLDLFQVNKSRLYKLERQYGAAKNTIELSIENKTGSAISRAYFKGTLASPDRSVPWAVDSFNYEIPGGVEPKEKTTWQLSPNMFSKLGSTEIPSGSIFTVRVTRLDDASGNPIADSRDFSEKDSKRLAELKSQYSE